MTYGEYRKNKLIDADSFRTQGMCQEYLIEETGKTAQEYIQLELINMAKERILDTDKTISEIAYGLGFQYPQHFSRLFKKCVGCTPNEYRQQS